MRVIGCRVNERQEADMNIRRFIGIEGLNGSGKTTALKMLSETLVKQKGGIVRFLFSKRGPVLKTETFPPTIDDYIVVIEVMGKIVVIATGGDDWWVPEIAIKAIASISIEVDVFIAAVRKAVRTKRKYPSVRDGYCHLLGSCQKQFLTRDRSVGRDSGTAGYFADANAEFVQSLMEEIKK